MFSLNRCRSRQSRDRTIAVLSKSRWLDMERWEEDVDVQIQQKDTVQLKSYRHLAQAQPGNVRFLINLLELVNYQWYFWCFSSDWWQATESRSTCTASSMDKTSSHQLKGWNVGHSNWSWRKLFPLRHEKRQQFLPIPCYIWTWGWHCWLAQAIRPTKLPCWWFHLRRRRSFFHNTTFRATSIQIQW